MGECGGCREVTFSHSSNNQKCDTKHPRQTRSRSDGLLAPSCDRMLRPEVVFSIPASAQLDHFRQLRVINRFSAPEKPERELPDSGVIWIPVGDGITGGTGDEVKIPVFVNGLWLLHFLSNCR